MMEYSEANLKVSIGMVMNLGYTKEEAMNTLNGKNPDGSEFKQLPF